MKRSIMLFMLGAVLCCNSACKKDNDAEKEAGPGTYTFKWNGDNQVRNFQTDKLTLTTQGYGVFSATSKQKPGVELASTITLYFKSIPLASKEYKITSLSSVSTHDDEVAVSVIIYGDPGLGGGTNWTFLSEGDGSSKLNYVFENGKAKAQFSGVAVTCNSVPGNKTGVVSGYIQQ